MNCPWLNKVSFIHSKKINILANTRVDPGEEDQVIPLFTLGRVETLASDKHVIAKLPLVALVIINLKRLTGGVCMKVRFKSKATRGHCLPRAHDPSGLRLLDPSRRPQVSWALGTRMTRGAQRFFFPAASRLVFAASRNEMSLLAASNNC